MKTKCQGGCGRTATQKVVATQEVLGYTDPMQVCGYCAVTFVESGYKIAAYK